MENYNKENLSPFYKALVEGTPEEQQKMLLAAYPWMADLEDEEEGYTITDAFGNEVDELHDYGLEGSYLEDQVGEGDDDFKENLEEYNTFKFADESFYMKNVDDCKALISVLDKLYGNGSSEIEGFAEEGCNPEKKEAEECGQNGPSSEACEEFEPEDEVEKELYEAMGNEYFKK